MSKPNPSKLKIDNAQNDVNPSVYNTIDLTDLEHDKSNNNQVPNFNQNINPKLNNANNLNIKENVPSIKKDSFQTTLNKLMNSNSPSSQQNQNLNLNKNNNNNINNNINMNNQPIQSNNNQNINLKNKKNTSSTSRAVPNSKLNNNELIDSSETNTFNNTNNTMSNNNPNNLQINSNQNNQMINLNNLNNTNSNMDNTSISNMNNNTSPPLNITNLSTTNPNLPSNIANTNISPSLTTPQNAQPNPNITSSYPTIPTVSSVNSNQVNHKYANSNSNSNNTTQNNINFNPSSDNMRVAIRIRPALSREIEKDLPFRSIVITSKENKTCSLVEYIGAELEEAGRQKEWIQAPHMFQIHRFTFDEVFDINATQETVYNLSAKPAVMSVLEGYNSTIFAYGQTGTGKTYTMEGFAYDKMDCKRGIIPRTIEDIFQYIENNSNINTKFIIRAAYLQIYNEMISDLLVRPCSPYKSLNIREDKKKGLYVENLSEYAVRGPNDIYALLERGASSRAIANTNMNDVSSRSHAVFMIIVEQMITDIGGSGQQIIKIGKLNLVDLAGSERTRVTGATGKQLEESKKINKSLSALGNVINALTDPKGRTHIPYRDSKLTRLLENSLGGNCKTTMIATISPAQSSFNESLSTLNFAKRAKNIKNRPIINEDIDHNALIHQYETELKKIRKELEEKTKMIANNELILEQKNKEEKAKNDAIKAYETASKQLLMEREEKMKLENKIKLMSLQMIPGGQKIEDTIQFQNALQQKQDLLEKNFEQKLMEIERERETIEDNKAQVEAYNKLLYKQREIMNNLSSVLSEKEKRINSMEFIIDDLTRKYKGNLYDLQKKNEYVATLEGLLEKNKIPFEKEGLHNKENSGAEYLNSNINSPTHIPDLNYTFGPTSPTSMLSNPSAIKNKIYIPYEEEQNGKEYSGQLITMLSSEEKIKELNDIVSNKEKEITLLKRVSEKIFSTCDNKPMQNNTQNDQNNNYEILKLKDEISILKQQLNEKIQMINLQRQENESLEEHYSSIDKMYRQTEKENLRLINIKENLISSLDNIIKKIDTNEYEDTAFQGLRTDLVKVFQIVLDDTNSNNEEEDNNEDNLNNIDYAYINNNFYNSNCYSNNNDSHCNYNCVITGDDDKKEPENTNLTSSNKRIGYGAKNTNKNTANNSNNKVDNNAIKERKVKNNANLGNANSNNNTNSNSNMIKNIKITTVAHKGGNINVNNKKN